MRTAQRRLEERGYLVVNWGYPTLWKSIDQHAASLSPLLRRLALDRNVRSINFLTHSLGGILLRFALEQEKIAKVRRAVMLAPPNSGSSLAKISLGPFTRVFPAIAEISDAPDSLPNRLQAPLGLDVGIVAASSDFIVRVANTFLANQRDHCIVHATHFELPHHDETLQKAIRFLKTGSFGESQEYLPVAA